MQESIKEHDRDIRLARTQTYAVCEHVHETRHYYKIWNKVKFIDRDPHWYTRRVKEAIQIRLHPNNNNRETETPTTQKQESDTKADHRGNRYSREEWNNGRIEMDQSQPIFVI